MFYFVCETQLLNVGGKAAMYGRAETSRRRKAIIIQTCSLWPDKLKTYFYTEHTHI